ncbi:MAG: CheR family methyltransferase [Rhodothermales bacterium]
MSLLAQLDLPVRNRRSELSDQSFAELRAFIYDKTGIYFQDNKRYLLESRIGRRVNALKMPNFGAYCGLIRNGGMHRELSLLVNAVTINETFFFRNEAKFDIVEKELLPDIIEQRLAQGQRRVRIWSAACSTGDEPYTIALIVKERLQPRYPHVTFDIVGTDINTEVLEKAKAGIYGEYAVRNVPPTMLNRHFKREGVRYVLNPEVRRMVSFKNVNLMERVGMMSMRAIDIVLCANVLIYFDNKAKQQAVSSIYNSLNTGGYLLVGFSETLYGVTQSFQPVRFDKSIAYKKG